MIERGDYRVQTADGVTLRVRQVGGRDQPNAPVIVLVHGIAAPLEPTYDLPLKGYSILEELAGRGFRAVAFDHRNFGSSDRSAALEVPAIEDPDHRGAHSLDDSIEDIRAVVADACERFGVAKLTLFGSSRGAIQVIAYAVDHSDKLSMVIMNNPSSLCYLAASRTGDALAWMQEERVEAQRAQNYLSYTAEFQRRRWAKLFGDGSKVDANLQDAYIECCLRSDAEGCRRDPPVFRVPTESIPDRVPLVALEKLRVPCLVIEAEEKSRAHLDEFARAVPAGMARMIAIRDSDHFTLRNPRRFELVNIIEAAITGLAWGQHTGDLRARD